MKINLTLNYLNAGDNGKQFRNISRNRVVNPQNIIVSSMIG